MTPSDAMNLGLLAVSLLAAILGLIPLMRAAIRVLGGRESAQDLELLRAAAQDAVRAVEQTMRGAPSEAKLEAALDQVHRTLAVYGVKVDEDRLKLAVEAAVFLVSAGLELPAPPQEPAS